MDLRFCSLVGTAIQGIAFLVTSILYFGKLDQLLGDRVIACYYASIVGKPELEIFCKYHLFWRSCSIVTATLGAGHVLFSGVVLLTFKFVKEPRCYAGYCHKDVYVMWIFYRLLALLASLNIFIVTLRTQATCQNSLHPLATVWIVVLSSDFFTLLIMVVRCVLSPLVARLCPISELRYFNV